MCSLIFDYQDLSGQQCAYFPKPRYLHGPINMDCQERGKSSTFDDSIYGFVDKNQYSIANVLPSCFSFQHQNFMYSVLFCSLLIERYGITIQSAGLATQQIRVQLRLINRVYQHHGIRNQDGKVTGKLHHLREHSLVVKFD